MPVPAAAPEAPASRTSLSPSTSQATPSPTTPAPEALAALRALAASPRWPILFVHHGWGGGIARHIADLERLLADRCEIVHLTPETPGTPTPAVRLRWQRDGQHFDGVFILPGEMPQLIAMLEALGIVRLHYHHIHALPQDVLTLPQALGVPFDVTLHDYFTISGQYHLADHRGRFRGEPQPGDDDSLTAPPAQWPLTTAEWRALFGDFLGRAARVIAPSHDIAERTHRILPVFTPSVWPHPEKFAAAPTPLRIAVVGALSPEKGFNVVCACARDAEERGLPLSFRLLGTLALPLPELPLSRLSMSGEYDEADLPALIAAEKPDAFFFPAQVPESFCYALTPALLSGRPIVASRLGALIERLADTPATLLPWYSAPAEWNDALCRLLPPSAATAACDTEDVYRRRYLEALPATPRTETAAAARLDGSMFFRAAGPKNDEAGNGMPLIALYHAGVDCGRREARRELLRRLKALSMVSPPAPPPIPVPAPEWWLSWLEKKAAWSEGLGRWQRRVRRLPRMARTAVSVYRAAGARAVLVRVREKIFARRTFVPPAVEMRKQETQVAPLTLATSATPRVSILIAAFGEPLATFSCLKSVCECTAGIDYEVLVLDDASPQPLQAQLAGVEGVRFIRQPHNLGFLKNCNAGARAARGEILVFLNNDTLVTEGWLTALVETLENTPYAGLVGAQLCYPDGRLQEAGGIVFCDGSAWNYGRNDDPDHPDFHYRRDVDYCSGACIALRKTLFEQLGGFDERYAPAYYEDTDLAFQVRAAGHRVLYQPLARVIHFEGQTSGTDETQGVKRYQVINQAKFIDKWDTVLARQPGRHGDIRRIAEHVAQTRILVIDACMLTPDRDSGSLRMQQLLTLLADGHGAGCKVTFAASTLEYRAPYVGQLQARGIQVIHLPHFGGLDKFLQLRGSEYDVIVLSRLEVAAQWLTVVRQRAPKAFVVFDTVDLHFLRAEREADVLGSTRARALAAEQKKQELSLIRAVDRTWVVSPIEKTLLAPLLPGLPPDAIAVLSNIHEPKPAGLAFGERAGILFIGSFRHPPNVDAMLWYGSEVLQHVRRLLPGVVTTIIGGDLPPAVKALAADDVTVTGYVEDVEPYFLRSRVSIAPLRYGAGVKGKVNQAMSYGVPVVATPMAAEGMHLNDGEDVLIAEEPQAFAEAIVRVYREAALWQLLSAAGRANVESHFSRQVAQREIDATLAARFQMTEATSR